MTKKAKVVESGGALSDHRTRVDIDGAAR